MKKVFFALCTVVAFVMPAFADPAATGAINALRASAGQPALVYSSKLAQAAKMHANDMTSAGFFAHKGSNGSAVSDRVTAQGYKWCFAAENIAKGQKNLAAVMQSWAESSGHYQNMVHKTAREFGLARAQGDIWVMVLAAPC